MTYSKHIKSAAQVMVVIYILPAREPPEELLTRSDWMAAQASVLSESCPVSHLSYHHYFQ